MKFGSVKFFSALSITLICLGITTHQAMAWSPPAADLASIDANCGRTDIMGGIAMDMAYAAQQARSKLPDTQVVAKGAFDTAIFTIEHSPLYDASQPRASARYAACLNACNILPTSLLSTQEGSKQFEDICCKLKSFTPDTEILGPTISSFLQTYTLETTIKGLFIGSSYRQLDSRCNTAAVHTGATACLVRSQRSDINEWCCKDEEEKKYEAHGLDLECNKIQYTGTDTCKVDGVFSSCCVCEGKDASGNTRYLAGGGTGEYNCKSCTAVCSQLSASGQLKDAKPDFFNLPFTANGCTETLTDYEGTSAVNRGGDYDIKQREAVHQDMFCFTQAECALAAGDPGNFKPGHGCPNKGNEPRGYCRAPEPNVQLQNPIAGVKTIKDLRSFIALMFNVAMGLIIVTAALFFVWGGFKYMLTGVTKEIQSAKETMINSVIGLVLGLGAYAILANVAPNTLNLQTYDIDMINKLNFYNVVYCRDIKPLPKFADAGPPTEPKPFSSTYGSGFPLTLDKTKCGTEYFIEGSDSQAVCMGQECEDGGMCIACSAGMASGCKTTSAHEYRCSDCKLGGNVVAQERWKPDTVWYYLFCDKGGGDDYEVKLASMAEFEFKLSSDDKTSSSGSSGYVTAICVSDKRGPGKAEFKMTAAEVRNFFDVKCKDMTGPNSNKGMLMLAFIDQEVTTDLSGASAVLDNKSDILTGLNCGLGLGGPPLCALSILSASQGDNFYFPMNKNMCNKNLFQVSVPFNESLTNAIAGTEENTMRNIMEAMYKSKTDTKDIYKDIVSQAWTPEETAKMVENGLSQSCGFYASHSGRTAREAAE